MQQRLQLTSPARINSDCQVWVLGNNAGQEMMLIGESGDSKFPFVRSLGNRRPIYVRGDVTLSDVFKRRIHQLMLRAALKRSAAIRSVDQILPQISVIDRKHIAA